MSATKSVAGRRSRWIPWAFAGSFALVLGANVILVVEASRSWTGTVTETPFDTGNDYNRVIAETEKEAKLGWTVEAKATKLTDRQIRIEVTVGGPDYDEGTRVEATLLRPIGMHAPVPIALGRAVNGAMQADIKIPELGNWDLHLVIHDDGREFHTTRRLFIQ